MLFTKPHGPLLLTPSPLILCHDHPAPYSVSLEAGAATSSWTQRGWTEYLAPRTMRNVMRGLKVRCYTLCIHGRRRRRGCERTTISVATGQVSGAGCCRLWWSVGTRQLSADGYGKRVCIDQQHPTHPVYTNRSSWYARPSTYIRPRPQVIRAARQSASWRAARLARTGTLSAATTANSIPNW